MKKYRLIVLSIISVAGMLASCNGNGKTAEAEIERTVEEVATTGTLAGHDWVDLGLSVHWATCNVGASNSEEYGDYFSWGELSAKVNYEWSTYSMCKGSDNALTKYCNISKYGESDFTDNLTTLEVSDDAATANWGNGWRIPTRAELQELLDKCTWTWKNNGYEVKGVNGNIIFLPIPGSRSGQALFDDGKRGEYWSNSVNTDYPCYAYDIFFDSIEHRISYQNRHYGNPIRPVCAK